MKIMKLLRLFFKMNTYLSNSTVITHKLQIYFEGEYWSSVFLRRKVVSEITMSTFLQDRVRISILVLLSVHHFLARKGLDRSSLHWIQGDDAYHQCCVTPLQKVRC